jgi:hypothetical protein
MELASFLLNIVNDAGSSLALSGLTNLLADAMTALQLDHCSTLLQCFC